MNLKLFIETNNYDINKSSMPTPKDYMNQMLLLFNQYSLKNEDVTQLQWEKLQEIIYNKKIIEEKLKALNEVVEYSLDIVGGSLRDIMLGQPEIISDYDIVISCDGVPIPKLMNLINSLNIPMKFYNEELKEIKLFRIDNAKEQSKAKGYSLEESTEKYLNEEIEKNLLFSMIVNHLMSDSVDYKNYKHNNVKKKYMNFHITSINQFKGVNNSKIDLIVSEYSGINFLSTFDFELCKIKADLKNSKTKEDLLNNMVPLGSMLRDVNNNTLSVNAIKFPKESLKYFFNKHLLKLLKKYPDHKVNLYTTKQINSFTEEEKERWIFAQKLKMEVDMPEKGIKNKKIKI